MTVGGPRSHHSPGQSPPSPSSASPGTDEKNRGAPSWEANPGTFFPAGLLSGLAKPHKLANWRTAFKAGLRPPWQAPQSCLALLCLGLGVRARHSFTRLSGDIPGSDSHWHTRGRATWVGVRSRVQVAWAEQNDRVGMEGVGKRASSSRTVFKDWETLPDSYFYKL